MNYIREAITQQHIGEEAIALRRHLHAHPDLSEQEFPTMELVCEHLDAAGIPYKRNVAESGVVGLIKGAFPGPVIALRADMDALPIQEDHPDAPYCSKTAGVMHACGHDAHTAILWERQSCSSPCANPCMAPSSFYSSRQRRPLAAQRA